MTTTAPVAPFISVSWDGAGARMDGIASHTAGDPAAQDEQGCFARWSWDGSTLSLENDRYGFVPLFYWESGTGVTVAPSIRTLLHLGAPRDLDYEALGVFVRCGFFLGEDTPFGAVRALPPGANASWANGRLSVRGGPAIIPLGADRARDEVIDTYAQLFRESIARCRPHEQPIVLPVSGGRDSRHILFALREAGALPVACVTYEDGEAAIARRLAAVAGVPHETVNVSWDRFALEREKNWATELLSDEHAPYMDLADRLMGRGTVYDGIAGGVLSAGAFLSGSRLALASAGSYESLAREVLADYYTRLLHPDIRARASYDAAVARVAREFARHAGAASRVGSFYFWNRTRREIALAPYLVYNAKGANVPVRMPYLDHRLFDYMFSLPPTMTADGRLHDDTIARHYPESAVVPYYERAGMTGRERWRARAFGAQILAREIARPSGLMDRRFLYPRLMAAQAGGEQLALIGTLGPRAAYLRQLAGVIAGGAVPPTRAVRG